MYNEVYKSYKIGLQTSAQKSKFHECNAFTLAEVLITLGIIGIVEAMTMPALIGKWQKLVTVNKLKDAYAIIAQGVKRAEVDYGPVKEWTFKDKDDFTITS